MTIKAGGDRIYATIISDKLTSFDLPPAQLRLILCSGCTATAQHAHLQTHLSVQTPLTSPNYSACGTILAGILSQLYGKDCFQGVIWQMRPKSGPICECRSSGPELGHSWKMVPEAHEFSLTDF
jgi:hypothetical protein